MRNLSFHTFLAVTKIQHNSGSFTIEKAFDKNEFDKTQSKCDCFAGDFVKKNRHPML